MAKAKSKNATDTATAVAEVESVDPVRLMREQLQAEEFENRKLEGKALETYLGLVGRETLSKAEAQDLVEAARDLDYGPEQITADRELIRKARLFQAEHESVSELQKKLEDARAAYQQFLERIDLEETVLRERRHFYGRQLESAKSVGPILSLADSRPELFDFSVFPPRFRTPAK